MIMKSLDYAVRTGTGLLPSLKEVEFVFEPNLPEVYDDIAVNRIRLGLSELCSEITHHGNCTKVKVSAERMADVQCVTIAWDGVPLSADLIQRINGYYRQGAESRSEPSRHGTQIAGHWFNFVQGRVRIENHEDGSYRVRNVVELPIKP